MPKSSSPDLPPSHISPELQSRLLGLLPFGDDTTGLLSRVVSPHSRYRQRISYAQSERLRAGVSAELRPYIFSEDVPPANPREEGYTQYRAQPPVAVAARLSHTWYDADKCVALESGILLEKASAVYGLVEAVALLESNVSPNAEGYNLDISLKSWGPAHTLKNAEGSIKAACAVGENNPTIFGDAATTTGLINAVVDRLEQHRPMVNGQPIGLAFPRIG